ncbi:MAG: hypothetical protein IKU64_02805 [Bacteroides sp.]|nr:hypothetical protein [Bacteroides sp.]
MKIFSDILSVIFHPLLVPLFAFALLFVFSYLNIMPLPYQLFVLSIVGTFTILAPGLFIGIYKWINKWNLAELNERKRRFIPYLLTMMSYTTCLITMWKLHFPHYFSGILVSALIAMTICAILNFRWKVSVHLAGCGMYIGGLISYSMLFYFNPVWWLCGFILLSGIQGTARISYYQHTLLEVILGFMTGMFCGIIGILFI